MHISGESKQSISHSCPCSHVTDSRKWSASDTFALLEILCVILGGRAAWIERAGGSAYDAVMFAHWCYRLVNL